MSGCSSPADCSVPDGALKVSSDIAGIGILVAFIVTVVLAFGTMFLGYFMEFLPGDYLDWADWGFLQRFHFRRCCRMRYRGESQDGVPCRHMDYGSNDRKRRALNAFLLTLSDQQLVTGPAILLAAVNQRCGMSIYELQLVNGLAWLASTTHLATLIILREYFLQNRLMRDIRVVVMVLNLGLLLWISLLDAASSELWPAQSLQCLLDKLSSTLKSPDFNWISTIATLLFLVVNYVEVICSLYDQTILGLLRLYLQFYCCTRATGPHLNEDEYDQWYTTNVSASRFRPGSATMRDRVWNNTLLPYSYKITKVFHVCWAIFFDYQAAFLSSIGVLLLSLSYGITQLAYSRVTAPETTGSENIIDFGQFVPLFLLALPVLSALEIMFEARSHEPTKNGALSQSTKNIEIAPTDQQDDRNKSNKPKDNKPKDTANNDDPRTSKLHTDRSGTNQEDSSGDINLRLIYPYAEKQIRRVLYSYFLIHVYLSISTGVLIFFFPSACYVYVAMLLLGMGIKAGQYGYFMIHAIGNAWSLKPGDGIRPAGGSRAAAPSLRTVVSRELTQMSSAHDSCEEEENHTHVDVFSSPSRQTSGFEAHAGEVDIGIRQIRGPQSANS